VSKQILNNGEEALSIRTKINENFTEVYNHVENVDSKHSSSDIVNDSGVTGTNVDNALDTLKAVVDAITTGDSNATIGVYDMIASGSDTITATYTDLTYFDGLKVLLSTDGTNTSLNPTLNINSLGAKPIKIVSLEGALINPPIGSMPPEAILKYDGTNFILLNKRTTSINEVNEGLDNTGSNSNNTALTTLLTTISTSDVNIYFPAGVYLWDSDITIPSNFNLVFERGAYFKGSAGTETITLNCNLDAGLWQIFDNILVDGIPLFQKVYPQWFGSVSGDSYNAITGAIAALKNFGGGILEIPKKGSAYEVSNDLLVDFGDITIIINEDMTYTKTDFSVDETFKLWHIKGEFATPISNVKIIGNGCVLNGNGSNATNYTYDINEAVTFFHCCIFMKYVENFLIENVICDDGLVNSLEVASCRYGVIKNCKVKNSNYDNGMTISLSYTTVYDGENYDDINNIFIENCIAEDCVDLGFTSYQSSHVTFKDCIAYRCGNDGSAGQFNRGGGFSAEDAEKTGFKSFTKYLNCKAFDCTGRGFVFDTDYVYMDEKCMAVGTLNTTDVENSFRYGVAVSSQSKYNITVQGTFLNSAIGGIRYICSQGLFGENIVIKNVYIDTAEFGMYLKGIENIVVENCLVKNIHKTGDSDHNEDLSSDTQRFDKYHGIIIKNDDAVDYNQGGGTAVVKNCRTEGITNSGIQIYGFGKGYIDGCYTISTGLNSTAPFLYGIYFHTTTYGKLTNSESWAGTGTNYISAFKWNSACTNSKYDTNIYTDITTAIVDDSTNKNVAV